MNPNVGFRFQLKLYSETLGCSLRDDKGRYKDAYLDWWEEKEREEEMGIAVRTSGRVERSVFASNDEESVGSGLRSGRPDGWPRTGRDVRWW